MADPKVEPRGAWSSGLTDAIRLRDRGRFGAATDDDRPPPSTFPMTPAARAALQATAAKAVRRTQAAGSQRQNTASG